MTIDFSFVALAFVLDIYFSILQASFLFLHQFFWVAKRNIVNYIVQLLLFASCLATKLFIS